MGGEKSEVLQGTLDLMVLKTLFAMGPLHRRHRVHRAARLQQQGWIASEWGTSENNRRARFYSITRQGLKQLKRETENWERVAGVIERVLKLERQG
jgi:PadR family transcriptional regulator PadR